MSDSEYVMSDGFGRTTDVEEMPTSLIYLGEHQELLFKMWEQFDFEKNLGRYEFSIVGILCDWLGEIKQKLEEDGIVILTVSEE